MNIKEGVRRFGIAAGVLGFIAGWFISYGQLLPLLTRWQQYKNFQALISSGTVKNEIESLKVVLQKLPPPPPGYELDSSKPSPPQVKFVPHPLSSGDDTAPNIFDKKAALCGALDGLKINAGGIRAIHFSAADPQRAWTSTLTQLPCAEGRISEISMIETEDGQKVYRTDPPGFVAYFGALAFPLLGFLLPWGTLKALTWIGAGFFVPRKPNPPAG